MLDLGKIVKESVQKQGMLAWQYNTIGVSDAITMGGEGSCRIQPPSDLLTSILSRDALLPADSGNHRG